MDSIDHLCYQEACRLLCSDTVKDFRQIEALTKDLAEKPYEAEELLDKIDHNKRAMQKLGFITEVALEYAAKKGIRNPNLLYLTKYLLEWRKSSDLERGLLMAVSNSHMKCFLEENSNPQARRWGVLSTYSAKDLEKLPVREYYDCT